MEAADDLFCELLYMACIAGASRIVAREDLQTAPGMLRIAERHSNRATTLLDKLMARAGVDQPKPMC